MMGLHLVFVYGTLKRGEPNYPVVTDSNNGKATYEGTAQTSEKWPLVIASKYNIPYLLQKPGVGHQVYGELYSVDDKMLDFLDQFEGHPKYYTRLREKVVREDGSESTPWIYFLKDPKPHLLELPTLKCYSSSGAHGLRYVERSERPESNETLPDHYHQVKLF